MKNMNFSMSDNLYYLDQLGSIDDQLSFLRTLVVIEAQLCLEDNGSGFSDSVHLIVFNTKSRLPLSKLFIVRPGLLIRSFKDPRVVDLPAWLINHGFHCSLIQKTFKKLQL